MFTLVSTTLLAYLRVRTTALPAGVFVVQQQRQGFLGESGLVWALSARLSELGPAAGASRGLSLQSTSGRAGRQTAMGATVSIPNAAWGHAGAASNGSRSAEALCHLRRGELSERNARFL